MKTNPAKADNKKPDKADCLTEGSQFGFVWFGTPEGTRTPDLLVRSQSLYPTELPAHTTLHSA